MNPDPQDWLPWIFSHLEMPIDPSLEQVDFYYCTSDFCSVEYNSHLGVTLRSL